MVGFVALDSAMRRTALIASAAYIKIHTTADTFKSVTTRDRLVANVAFVSHVLRRKIQAAQVIHIREAGRSFSDGCSKIMPA